MTPLAEYTRRIVFKSKLMALRRELAVAMNLGLDGREMATDNADKTDWRNATRHVEKALGAIDNACNRMDNE